MPHAFTLFPIEVWAGMLTLSLVLVASLPTTREILRKGNEADPLRREIEEENRARPQDKDPRLHQEPNEFM